MPGSIIPTCCRHILTDAPGAGKTPMSIWTAQRLGGPAIVFAPAHLCRQWFQYLLDNFPEDRVVWLEGTRQNKQKDCKIKAKWYIVSIQSLRQVDFMEPLLLALIDAMGIQVSIIDESHYAKNPEAMQAQLLQKLTSPRHIPHAILLTATPIMKEADDLYMQLRICDPYVFHRQRAFLEKYCWFFDTSWGPQNIELKATATQELRKWMWGRTYAEIGLELPPLISPPPHVHTMVPARRKAYDDIKYTWWHATADGSVKLDANSAMEVMHMLRNLISSGEKQADLVSFLQDDPGPHLIATFYRQSAKDLAAYITKHMPTYNPIVVTGEIPADERPTLAKSATKPTDIVIATIPSISEGCDLSHMNTVYFYEEDWTPGKHYQFLSRVRRHRNESDSTTGTSVTITEDNHLLIDPLPNDRPVIVRYFHADKSIDQRIHAVLDSRATSIRDLVKVELGL